MNMNRKSIGRKHVMTFIDDILYLYLCIYIYAFIFIWMERCLLTYVCRYIMFYSFLNFFFQFLNNKQVCF